VPIIDIHLHLYPTRAAGRRRKDAYQIWEYGSQASVVESSDDGTPQEAIAALDRAGADYGVIANLFEVEHASADDADVGALPKRGSLAETLEQFNIWACDVASREPRLIPLVAVDPTAMDVATTISHLQVMRNDHGARGIKVHPVLQGIDPQNEAWWPVFETCAELGMIVLSHSGPARGTAISAEPRAFQRLIRHLPRLRLVLAHAGGGAWRATAEAAEGLPGVFFDICEIIERTGSEVGPTTEELGRLISQLGSDRVLFGSDWPWYEPRHGLEVLRSLPGLSEADVDAIAGGNAAQLLGIR
jgi:predicted TIM-barrel fold metal-dependent hydrolase